MRLIPVLIVAVVLVFMGLKIWPDASVWPLVYFTFVGSIVGGMLATTMVDNAPRAEGQK